LLQAYIDQYSLKLLRTPFYRSLIMKTSEYLLSHISIKIKLDIYKSINYSIMLKEQSLYYAPIISGNQYHFTLSE